MAKVLFVVCVPAREKKEAILIDKNEEEKEEEIDDKTAVEAEEKGEEEGEKGETTEVLPDVDSTDVDTGGWNFKNEDLDSEKGKITKKRKLANILFRSGKAGAETVSLKSIGSVGKPAGDTISLKSDVGQSKPSQDTSILKSADGTSKKKPDTDSKNLRSVKISLPEGSNHSSDKEDSAAQGEKGAEQNRSEAEGENENTEKENVNIADTEEVKEVTTVDADEAKKVKSVDDKENGESQKDKEQQKESSEEEKEQQKESSVDYDEYVHFLTEDWSLIEKVKAALDALGVTGIHWSLSEDHIYVGMFIAGDGVRCEEILDRLSYLKIGVINKSSISVFPASISIASIPEEQQAEQLKRMLEKNEDESLETKLAEKVSEFKKSIKSRLVVAQVVDSVKSDALFTFDYLMLLILASLVAVMGLVEASSVTLVASMLISPLMGPILAGVFGAVIQNIDLVKVGIKSELMGLGVCILVGFVTGFIPAALEYGGANWRYVDSWPTFEMSSRGALRALPVGVMIAVPSGAGVALSILGGKVGSLVGVAISASLLPPAVNAGLLWANAIVAAIVPPPTVQLDDRLLNSTAKHPSSPWNVLDRIYYADAICPQIEDNEYVHYYYCDMANESAVLGLLSLLLTVLNIGCIIIMGIVVLKIKEVAPIRSVPLAEKDFFGKDLKIARGSYETTKGQDCVVLGKKFLQEYKTMKQQLDMDDDDDTNANQCNALIEEVEGDPDVQEISRGLFRQPTRCSSFIETSEDYGLERNYKTYHIGTSESGDSGIVKDKQRASFTASTAQRNAQKSRRSHYVAFHRSDSTPDRYFNRPFSPIRSDRFLFKHGRFKVEKVEEEDEEESEASFSTAQSTPTVKFKSVNKEPAVKFKPVNKEPTVKFKSVNQEPESTPLLDKSV